MEYDIIIIGAGPAGCSTALNSAKFGLKTLLIEEHKVIGEPVHCGECLSEFAVQRLGIKLPKEVISKEVKGVKVIFPDGKSAYIKEKGFVLEKHKFEQWLAKESAKLGAEIKLGLKVLDAVKKEFWTIKCSDNSEFKTKILIDATGSSAFLSEKLNLNKRYTTIIGMQYELKDIPEEGYLDFYLWPKMAPEGYLWMIPKSNGRANVGLTTTERNKAKTFLDEFMKQKNWENKVKVKTFGGLIPISGAVEKTFDDGLILVGDAAGFASPLFEGGTSLSLTSGKFAAQIAKKAVEQKNYSKEVLAEYETLWRKEFPAYDKIMKGKNALYNLTEEELNFIGKFMPKNISQVSFMERIQIIFKILIKKPNLFGKGILSAAKAFSYSRAKYYGW